MAVDVLLRSQVLVKYESVNVAQVNEALVTYASNETIVAGLTALKDELIAAVPEAAACVQCGGAQASGTITKSAVVYVCPLCEGMTKTDGTYVPVFGEVLGYNKV